MSTIWALSRQLKRKEISPVDLVQSLLERIDNQNPTLNAYVTVTREQAIEAARIAETEIIKGHYRGPLQGIPIGLKDLILTQGIRTTMGSKIFQDHIPDKDAEIVTYLKKAGTIILGKLHTHEFAYGPTGDRSYFGSAKNPHNPLKITGGSSSGAGAAVAGELALAAIGTDTGGSVRIPAAACGVVGLKPTVGSVSAEGVFPLSETLDHVGPLTKTVVDNALVFKALLNDEKGLRTFSPSEIEDFDLATARIGIPKRYFLEDLEDEVRQAFNRSAKQFEMAGAQIIEIDVPNLEEILWGQSVVQMSEAFAIHEEWVDTRGDDYDQEVYERLLDSKNPRGYEYVKAMHMKPKLKAEIDACFDKIDIWVTPTLPILPTDIGQREVEINGKRVNIRSALLKNTRPWNYTGHPALSIPIGQSKTGLPIGMQLIGPYHQENLLFKIGNKLEQLVYQP